jgi:hypothetical protein
MDSSLQTIIIVAVVVLGLGFGAKLLFGSRDGKSQAGPSTHERKRCACGWEGLVSRFVKKCPKCGSPV